MSSTDNLFIQIPKAILPDLHTEGSGENAEPWQGGQPL
jgi:hypothetical protein